MVVRVAGSGLCHTDFTVISRDQAYWKGEASPFTLGHEIAGWVEEVETGVTKFKPGVRRRGQPVLGQLRPLSHVPLRGAHRDGQHAARARVVLYALAVGTEMGRNCCGNKLDRAEGALTDATGFRPLYA